jgi:ATP-binding cassette, subfamily C (CFTR/MRP), member 1
LIHTYIIDSGSNDNLAKYLTAYGLFSLSSTILGAVSSLLIWVTCSMRSAKYLHDNMLHAVLRAPLSFFEQTPTGRTLNLFSRDVYVIDSVLGRVIQGMLFICIIGHVDNRRLLIIGLTRTLCMTLGIIAIIGGALPPFLIAVVPLGWFYWRVMQYYLGSSRGKVHSS